MKFSRLIAAGIFLSLASHAAVSAYFALDPNQVDIAASEGGAVSVIGSLEDLVAGTDGSEEAVEVPPEEMRPVENSQELTAVQPDRTPQSTPDAPKAVEVASAAIQPVVKGVTDTRPVTAETVPPETPRAEPLKTAAEELKPVVPDRETTATVSEVKAATTSPQALQADVPETEALPPEAAVQPVPQEVAEAKPVETLEAAAPAPPVKPEPPDRKKVAQQKQKQKKKLGADRSSRRGGELVTSTTGGSNANGRKGGTSNDGGTKARSNYNGKVLAKLRRAKRYPSQARRDHLQGTVTVRFTVMQNGSVSGISLARSSGHAVLDQAALEMVHRAAPMPRFPDDIRQKKLSFTVPVHFSR